MSYRILEFQPNLFSARLLCSHYKEVSRCKNPNNDSGECSGINCPLKHSDWWKEELLEWIEKEKILNMVSEIKLKQKIKEL